MFQKMKISLPELAEQQKIAKVLSTADQEIEALQRKLDGLQQREKSLDAAIAHRQTPCESGGVKLAWVENHACRFLQTAFTNCLNQTFGMHKIQSGL